ncbi:MAG: glycosyltransferase [Firmicutes bacterium]|nr:glycosyltransferase [Bacillota bacterium]
MRIAWFSPLPPLKSGISEYSETVVYELRKHAVVDLWVENIPQLRFCRDFRVYNYGERSELLPLLETYDAIVYNMGNNAEFHAQMYDVLQVHPGIVILHDYVLHHFFAGYFLDKRRNSASYIREVHEQYGAESADLARKCLEDGKPLWEREEVFHYPLNRTVLDRARGLVVHSEYARAMLRKQADKRPGLTTKKIDQPVSPLSRQHHSGSREELGLPKDKIIVASLGFITPSKRLHKVIGAVAEDRFLRERVVILVIGESISPDYRLEAYATKYGIAPVVRMLGYLPIEAAYAYLRCADICVNLRYPTMGETSSSLIRIMSLGKPTLVSNVGWYADLPDDSVVKIDPLNEEEGLTSWLRRLVSDGELRDKIGETAKAYVEREHSLEKFVRELCEFIQETGAEGSSLYIRVLDRITDTLNELGQGADLVLPHLPAHLAWLYLEGGKRRAL